MSNVIDLPVVSQFEIFKNSEEQRCMLIHWCDCAIYHGPAYPEFPAGPCDCGMLEVANQAVEEFIGATIALPGSFGNFVEKTEPDRFFKQQNLPSGSLIADAATSHLPDQS